MGVPGKVAILGANGAIGRTLGPMLSQRSIPYRVVGRSLLALQVRFHEDPLCEHHVWDTEDKAAFAPACSGTETVVYLVGAALWKFKDHLPLMEQTLAAARQAGVRRFLLMTPNWSYGPPYGARAEDRISEQHPRNPPTAKGKIRRDQEDLVLAAHAPGQMSTAVLRVADLYGPRVEASPLWSAFQAAKRGTEAQVLGPVDQPHEFVFVPDAAATLAKLLETDAAWTDAKGQAWNLGGPAVTTIREMVELIFATERKPANYRVPGKLMIRLVRAMNPYIREMQEMAYLQQETLLLDDAKLATVLGTLAKTPYASAIRQTLAMR